MLDVSADFEWYLAQVKPNGDATAVRNLRRQRFDVVSPKLETETRRANRVVLRRKPLFPGYLFLGVGPDSAPIRCVSSTYGVNRLVAFGGAPRPVPHSLIEEMSRRCDADGNLLPPDELKKGDTVKVVSGPFAGFVSEVTKVDAERRVWLLLDFLGSAREVSFEKNMLQTESLPKSA